MRALMVVSGVCHVGFWTVLLLDEFGTEVPRWIGVAFFVAGAPSVLVGLSDRRRAADELTAHDVRTPDWLAFTPLGKIVVVLLGASAAGGLFAAFGASWWQVPAIAAAILLATIPRPTRSTARPARTGHRTTGSRAYGGGGDV